MPQGQHRSGYRHPLVREPRRRMMPFLIDRLPRAVGEAIVAARAEGRGWKETAEIASRIAGRKLWSSMCCRWYWARHGTRVVPCPTCGTELSIIVVDARAPRPHAKRG